MNLKCATTELVKSHENDLSKDNINEFYWALTMDYNGEGQAQTHPINYFHVKGATVIQDHSIIVIARGKIPNTDEFTSTLLLTFDVQMLKGKYALILRPNFKRVFPNVFPRQLDHI